MPRLLFVDDQWNDYLIWGKSLGIDHGWEVEYAAGVAEALAKLAEKVFDVVIIDRWMPDPKTGQPRMVGDELLEQVTARWRYVCPIVLTNFGDLAAAQRATRYGAYRYFVKGVPVAQLDEACRKGMTWQLFRRFRRTLSSLPSVEHVLAAVKGRVKNMLHPPGYCFAFLPVGPHGGLTIGDSECGVEAGPLARALREKRAFIEQSPCAREVVETRQFSLRSSRSEIDPAQGTLIDSPGSQLLVPVMKPEDPGERSPAEVCALLWVESIEEKAFDREDADILCELGDYVGMALDKVKEVQEEGADAQKTERQGLLDELAHRICDPLQVAQSTLDLLIARLAQGAAVAPNELEEELSRSRASVEQAIQEAYQLRQVTQRRPVTLVPTDLRALLDQSIAAFAPRFELYGCKVERRVAAEVPKVKLDAAEMRYVVGCLLQNALEAIERRRAGAEGEPVEGRILVTLCADPTAGRDVAVGIRDNGGGIAKEHLPHLFNRYFTTKEPALRRESQGLGLWAAKRFVDGIGGSILVRNVEDDGGSDRGALFQILLKACDPLDPPEEILLP